mgnify:CR=1 FL=1
MTDSPLRARILDATAGLTIGGGWAAVSMGKIASAVGVSRQTVYKEFGSRQSIAEAYVMRRLDAALDEVEANMRDNPDLESALQASISTFFELVDAPLVQTVLAGGVSSPDLIQLIEITNRHATERLAALFKEIRPGIPDGDAVVFGDTIARVCAAHAFAPTLERDEATRRVVRLMVVLLAAH